MSGELLNSLTGLLPNVQWQMGRVTFSGGTPSLSALSGSPLSDQTQVSIADDGTGLVTISVANFGDATQTVLGYGTSNQQDTLIATSLGSWSGTTVSVPFNIATAGTLTDANFNYLIVGFPTT
jgi:hypothetical protein